MQSYHHVDWATTDRVIAPGVTPATPSLSVGMICLAKDDGPSRQIHSEANHD